MQPLFTALLGKVALIPPKANGEHWIAVPLVSAAQRAGGIAPGGEGCQYPQTIAIDATSGEFILFGTDVGGVYRSVNGGKSFSPCDMGFHAQSACAFAMDPKNPDRVLAIGDNAGGDYYEYDGVYLSTNRGASWRHVLPKLNKLNEKGREQTAFDPASYDTKLGYCAVAYWAEEGNAKEPGGRLYKSRDGGETWTEIANGAAYGGGKFSTLLKVAPPVGRGLSRERQRILQKRGRRRHIQANCDGQFYQPRCHRQSAKCGDDCQRNRAAALQRRRRDVRANRQCRNRRLFPTPMSAPLTRTGC